MCFICYLACSFCVQKHAMYLKTSFPLCRFSSLLEFARTRYPMSSQIFVYPSFANLRTNRVPTCHMRPESKHICTSRSCEKVQDVSNRLRRTQPIVLKPGYMPPLHGTCCVLGRCVRAPPYRPDVQIPTGVLEAAAGTLAQSLHPSCQLLTGLGPNVPSLGGRVEVTLLVRCAYLLWMDLCVILEQEQTDIFAISTDRP